MIHNAFHGGDGQDNVFIVCWFFYGVGRFGGNVHEISLTVMQKKYETVLVCGKKLIIKVNSAVGCASDHIRGAQTRR